MDRRELTSMIFESDGQDERAMDSAWKELEQFPLADGYVALVEQAGGRLAFTANGPEAWAKLNALVSVHRFSPLEVYQILGGSRKKAPIALRAEHEIRVGSKAIAETSQLPRLAEIAPSLQLNLWETEVGLIQGEMCRSGSIPCFDSFQYVWETYKNWDHHGANGYHGFGKFSGGNGVLNLGPTSAGVAVICVCESEGFGASPKIIVEERIGTNVWAVLWPGGYLFHGQGYGVIFSGFLVRRIRIVIDNTQNVGKSLFWAGSF